MLYSADLLVGLRNLPVLAELVELAIEVSTAAVADLMNLIFCSSAQILDLPVCFAEPVEVQP